MKNYQRPQLKQYLLIILVISFYNALIASDSNCGIYVWDFQTDQGVYTSYTRELSELYEIALIRKYSNRVLERKKLNLIEWQRKNEISLSNLPEALKNQLKSKGANFVVWGEVKAHKYKDINYVTITITNLFTNENIFKERIELDTNKDPQENIFSKVVPNQLVCSENEKSVENLISSTYSFDILLTDADPWKKFQKDYIENFANFRSKNFARDVWTLDKSKECDQGVFNNTYQFKIKKTNFTQYKYIPLKYLVEKQQKNRPISIDIKIKSDTINRSFGYGRGIMVRYKEDKEKNGFYVYCINDQGELTFLKKKFGDPINTFDVLDISHEEIISGKVYNLGIIDFNDKFYLFFNNKFMKVITDDEIADGLYGVFVHGEGVHEIDNITLYKSIK